MITKFIQLQFSTDVFSQFILESTLILELVF